VVTIRDLEDRDLPAAHALNEANVPEVGPIERDRLAEQVEMATCSLVAELDADVVGFCIVFAPGADYHSVNYRWFMDRYTDACYLDRVAVRADARGRGIGTALYATVEDHLRREHPWARTLTLEVNVDPPNERSLAFHAARGFGEVGRQRTPYGTEVSLLAKPLEPTNSP
jgi:predicted GNAT superfamily acetyltransferase